MCQYKRVVFAQSKAQASLHICAALQENLGSLAKGLGAHITRSMNVDEDSDQNLDI